MASFQATSAQLSVLEKLRAGTNVLMVGEAGTGKTATVKFIHESLAQEGRNVMCIAPTGLASLNFEGGKTIASFVGLGCLKPDKKEWLKKRAAAKLTPSKNADQQFVMEVFRHRFTQTEFLIIDEVSMTTDFDFEMLEFMFRRARNNLLLFGGVTILTVGDFRQIPPVNVEGTKAFLDGAYFGHFEVVKLSQVFRQKDTFFIDLLNRAAKGELTGEDEKWFASRTCIDPPEDAVALFATNATCEAYNERCKVAMDGDDEVFVASVCAQKHSEAKHGKSKKTPRFVKFMRGEFEQLSENEQKAIEEAFGRLERPGDAAWMARANNDKRPVSSVVSFRKGAPVMVRANGTFAANGTMATFLEKTAEGFARIRMQNGTEHTLETYSWEAEVNGLTVSYRQIPLVLAFSITIHKAQGQGFGKMWVDFSDMRRWPDITKLKGMAYVVISRAIDPAAFYQKGFDKRFFVSDPKAIEFYNSLE